MNAFFFTLLFRRTALLLDPLQSILLSVHRIPVKTNCFPGSGNRKIHVRSKTGSEAAAAGPD